MALANIAFNSDALRDRVVEAGALPALVRALQGAPPGSGAAEQAAGVLMDIAAGSSDARCDCVVEAGALPALVRALGEGTVPGSEARKQAAIALFNLSLSPTAKAALRDTHDGVAKLRAAREKFSADAGLVSEIDDVLRRL